MKVYKGIPETYFKVIDVINYLDPENIDLVENIYDDFISNDEKIEKWQISEVLDFLTDHIHEKLTKYVESD